MPTETQKSYLAGLLDGDGCLNLCICKDKRNGKKYAHGQVIIVGKDFDFMSKVRSLIGFGGLHRRKSGFSGGWSWGLHINRVSQLKEFIQMVQPYSIGKTAQLSLFNRGMQYLSEGNADLEVFRLEYSEPLSNLNQRSKPTKKIR